MKNILVAGCSFTEQPESYLFLQPQFRHHIPLNEYFREFYNYNLEEFYSDLKILNPADYRLFPVCRSSISNTLLVRSVIYQLENHLRHENIKYLIYQITGYGRREILVDKIKLSDYTHDSNKNTGVSIGDLTYLMQDASSIDYNSVLEEENPPFIRKASAYFYTMVTETEDYMVKNVEALRALSLYCQANDINISYFNGWNNLPRHNSEYFYHVFRKYVEPYLLTKENIFSHASTKLSDQELYGPDGGHPSGLAHKLFWNDIVYPHIISYR